MHIAKAISSIFYTTYSGLAGIYPLPFTVGWLGNITPSERMGWDISTPLHSGPAGKYHMPSERMGRDISTPLHSGPAGKYHMPSERMGQDLSTPLHSGPAGKYHMPSERMGRDISLPFTVGQPRNITCL